LHWDFPGGKLEPGEEPFKGIEREVMEEVSLKIKATKVVGVYDIIAKGIPHRFTVYDVIVLEGEPKLSNEHLEFKWRTKEEILTLKREPFLDMYFEEH